MPVFYDNQKNNILIIKWSQLTDSKFVHTFFEENRYKISRYLQKAYGLEADQTEDWMNTEMKQADSFFSRIFQLVVDANEGKHVNFDKEFKPYKELSGYPGVKVYGPKQIDETYEKTHDHKSLLRLWALQVGKAYLVVYIGIKLDYEIQDCPGLREELKQRLKTTASFLKAQTVLDEKDLERLVQALESLDSL